MINKIKQLADEAIKLQNKDRMDAVLREISVLCVDSDEQPIHPVNIDPITAKKHGGKK